MKGGYDLYGNYYPNINDAMNAEMAQCNEIDNSINRKKIEDLERKSYTQYPSNYEETEHLWSKIGELEKRIKSLESK